jgi:hypothetical protein
MKESVSILGFFEIIAIALIAVIAVFGTAFAKAFGAGLGKAASDRVQKNSEKKNKSKSD